MTTKPIDRLHALRDELLELTKARRMPDGHPSHIQPPKTAAAQAKWSALGYRPTKGGKTWAHPQVSAEGPAAPRAPAAPRRTRAPTAPRPEPTPPTTWTPATRQARVQAIQAQMAALQAELREHQSALLSDDEANRMVLETADRLHLQWRSGAPVLVDRLRKEFPAQVDKETFDRHIMRMARDGTLVVHGTDRPWSMSPAERDELVTDGRDNYFVAISLRRHR